ncbi:hypothetical protein [Pseudorhodobacter ferrugineus]|uniref:hypothetical protein n=1 Tax=Pseudorhodobacter ferrugineus TaxID=77008 RepID=UPI0004201C36|nr:hypothetical protein [Pseudorhodobacter ferrugineus]
MDLTLADPKGLIRESYRIDGITAGECRSIFMDWALSLPLDADTRAPLLHLIATYGTDTTHPMTAVLQEGLKAPTVPKRKGGRAARLPENYS